MVGTNDERQHMTTTFTPPTTSIDLDWSYEGDDLLAELVEATSAYESMTYRLVVAFGPAGGAPIVRFVAQPDELDAFVLAYCSGDGEQAREYLGDDALR